MSKELKPCPFCGGSEILRDETCGVSTNVFQSSKMAEAAWNLRTPIEAIS